MEMESEIKERLTALEKQTKEQEPSFLRAIRTLLVDLAEYKSDADKDFPTSAFLGVVYSYLRPRLIIAVAGLIAVIIAGLQVVVVIQQNRLIERQNSLIESQTDSNQLEAMTNALALVAAGDSSASAMSTVLIAQFEDQATPIVLALLESRELETHKIAFEILRESATQHDASEAQKIVFILLNRIIQQARLNPKTFDLFEFGESTNRLARYINSLPKKTRLDMDALAWEALSRHLNPPVSAAVDALNKKLQDNSGVVAENSPYPTLHFGLEALYLSLGSVCSDLLDDSEEPGSRRSDLSEHCPVPSPALPSMTVTYETGVIQVDPRRLR